MKYGEYPEISLKTARLLHSDAKKLINDGIDPFLEGKPEETKPEASEVDENSPTFREVGEEWLERKKPEWSDGHLETVVERLTIICIRALAGSKLTRSQSGT